MVADERYAAASPHAQNGGPRLAQRNTADGAAQFAHPYSEDIARYESDIGHINDSQAE
jgi:hypothetical protein